MPANVLGLTLICGAPGCQVPPGLCQHLRTPADIVRELLKDKTLIGKALNQLECLGLAGERTNALALILVLVSRQLERPLNAHIFGPSSSGKSFLAQTVIKMFPADAVYELTAMSERALVFTDADFRHKVIFIHETTGIPTSVGKTILRTIVWDGRLRYETVEKTRDGFRPRLIEKEGPTGIITTSTRLLEEELSTRLLTLYIRDDPSHTKAVLRRIARGSHKRLQGGVAKWRRLFASLPTQAAIEIPYAGWLADCMPADRVRVRRDFTQLLTAIRASALLHHVQRDKTVDGAIEANVMDYAIAHAALGPSLGSAATGSLTKAQMEAVDAVQSICDAKDRSGKTPVTNYTEVAARLRIDVSSAKRRLAPALREGVVFNENPRPYLVARLVPGYLPHRGAALPTVGELATQFPELLP